MKIAYDKNDGVMLVFGINELKFALAVLKAMHKSTGGGEGFMKKAIEDIEADLKPKLLTHVNYFHWCVKCGRDIDERDENTMRISHESDVKWQCRKCKPLKIKRPN